MPDHANLNRQTELAVANAQRHIDQLRRELDGTEADLHLWARGAPAHDHPRGLYHAADTSSAIAVAFALIRARAEAR